MNGDVGSDEATERRSDEGERAASRYDVTFTGRVQGVNFRWTTCRVAERFAVAGWVRNEPDGSVRCVAEGEASELDRFIQSVGEAMAGNIRDTRITRAPAQGDLEGFSIRS